MEFKKVGLTVVAAFAAGLLFAACPSAQGTLGQACTDNLSCSEGEVCHPTAKVCAETCAAPGDCATEACNPVPGTQESVCACSSDDDCGSVSAEAVCLTSTPRVCGVPGDGEACEVGTCGAGQICKDGTCVAGASCTGEGQSSCAYGQYCKSGTCADVAPRPTCQNFTGTDTGDAKATWTPATGSGPVIYRAELASWGQGCYQCQSSAPVPVCIRLFAYKPDGTWAASPLNENTGSFFVPSSGESQEMTKSNAFFSTATGNWVVNGENLNALVRLCVAQTTTQQSFGFYFSGGNEVCPSFSSSRP